ncbi:zinc finger protein 260-like isoform X6 [Bacillus rossius redtenbacheri]|uniref:zinc finger protein 260-like isoform X6 n=1 Tax=Bacillus rossius redtenbacheri TaxID=93214 RepID=UPI002FDCB96C
MSAGSKSSDGLDDATCTIMETSMLEEEGYFDPAEGSGAGLSGAGGKKRLESLCRVCANVSDYFIPVFEREGAEHQLDMKIRKHLPIRVLETDGLPAQVCYQCASTLIAWHDLVTACVEADKKLHRLLLEEEDDDYADRDEKVVEFFNEPPVDSDGEDFSEPSTSAAVVETKECLPPQKKRTSGKGKQQRKAQRASNASPESGAKGNTALSDSKETGAGQKGAVDSALSTERYSDSSLGSNITVTQELNFRKAISEAAKSRHPVTDWIKLEEHDLSIKSEKLDSKELLQSESGVSEFECDICKKTVFDTKENFIVHVESHGSVGKQRKPTMPSGKQLGKRFVCQSKQFLVKNLRPKIVRNSRKVNDSKSVGLKCDSGPDSAQRKELRRSGVSFPGKPRQNCSRAPLACSVCGREFSRRHHLCRHERSHGAQEGGQVFQCGVCGKKLACKATLRTHQAVHSAEKPCTCHVCGKRLSQTGLYYHLRHVHGGVKQHACAVCGRSFAARPALEDHLRVHTGERPYVCAACGKTFKTKATLYVHGKTHSDVFPFACPRCAKPFRNRHELVKHAVTHTGEKPHACDVCGRRFRARNEVAKHRLLHSEDKPYVCAACGLGFKQLRYLKRHAKTHHPDN